MAKKQKITFRVGDVVKINTNVRRWKDQLNNSIERDINLGKNRFIIDGIFDKYSTINGWGIYNRYFVKYSKPIIFINK